MRTLIYWLFIISCTAGGRAAEPATPVKPAAKPAARGAPAVAASAGGVSKRPVNSVVLFVDDLGRADLTYRLKSLPTPNLDRLFADGMTFTHAYAASPTCSPSRAALLTGRHPARLRLVRHLGAGRGDGEFHLLRSDPAQFPSRNWLPLEECTYAEMLKPAGYDTAFGGKWHLGPKPYFPTRQGFDEQFGTASGGHPHSYYPPFFGKRSGVYADADPNEYLTDRLTDDAVSYLQRRDPAKPFHLSLYYYAVHSPHVGRRDLVASLADTGLTGEELHHAAMLLAVDESVGRIRAALQQRGLADNTLLLFIGDQGGLFDNSPLRGGKMGGTALYEGGARVPFAAVWPRVVQSGVKCATPVTTLDVFPTLAALAGKNAAPQAPLDGHSLLPLLTQSGDLQRDQIVLYRSYGQRYAAIRTGDWKLVAYRSGQAELYNLKDDPSERRDLAGTKPMQRNELLRRLIAWEQRMGVSEFTPRFTFERPADGRL